MRIKQLFAPLLILLLATQAHAAIQQIRVLGVGVDRSRLKAEELALEYAKKRAVYLVARKMEAPNVSDKVAAFTPEDYASVIRGANVIRTRREDRVSYSEVMVSVIDTELRRLLGLEMKVPTLDEAPAITRSVLVLPVLMKDAAALLWQKENKLRQPLSTEVLRQSHGAVLVPAGDFEDLRLIDGNNALEVTAPELKPMFKRYGADEIVIAVVRLGAVGTLGPTEIILRRLSLEGSRNEMVTLKPGTANDTLNMRIESAAHAVATATAQIAASTAEDEQEVLKKARQIPVQFRYATPRELATLQKALREAEGVVQLRIPTITLQKVSGTLFYTGEEAALRQALKAQGVIIGEGTGGSWIVSLR